MRTYKWSMRRFIILLAVPVVAAGIVFAWGSRPKSEQTAPSSAADGITNNVKSCAGAEVSSIRVSTDLSSDGILFDDSPIITIGPNVPGKPLIISVLGPILGSMDSSKVKTDLACTGKGFVLTATVTRSADYRGAVLANVHWRPRIKIAILLNQPKVIFQTIWRMRLTTGNELDHAQTPPYAKQSYPIILTKTLRRD